MENWIRKKSRWLVQFLQLSEINTNFFFLCNNGWLYPVLYTIFLCNSIDDRLNALLGECIEQFILLIDVAVKRIQWWIQLVRFILYDKKGINKNFCKIRKSKLIKTYLPFPFQPIVLATVHQDTYEAHSMTWCVFQFSVQETCETSCWPLLILIWKVSVFAWLEMMNCATGCICCSVDHPLMLFARVSSLVYFMMRHVDGKDMYFIIILFPSFSFLILWLNFFLFLSFIILSIPRFITYPFRSFFIFM